MTTILLFARLRWYALATGQLLLRRWQALLLILAILAPASTPLLSQVKSLGVWAAKTVRAGANFRFDAFCRPDP